MVEPHQNTLHESLEDGGESKRNHLNSYNPFGATKAVFSCELKCMQIYQYPVATSRVEKYTDSLSWSSNQSMGEEKCQPWSLNLALGNQHRTCVYHPSSHKHNGTCPWTVRYTCLLRFFEVSGHLLSDREGIRLTRSFLGAVTLLILLGSSDSVNRVLLLLGWKIVAGMPVPSSRTCLATWVNHYWLDRTIWAS